MFIDANCDVCISVGETGLGAGTVNNKLSIWRNQFIRATGNSIIQFSKVGYAFGNIKANLFVNNTVFQPASSGIISLADSGVAVRGNIFNDAPIFKEIYLTSTNALYGKTDVSENFWYNRDIANVINNSTLVFLPASTITFENNVIPTVDPAFAAQMKDQSLVSFSVYDFPQNMDALKLRYLVFDDLTLDISQRYSTVGCTSKNTSMVECGAMPKYDSSFDVEDVILSYKSEFVFPIYPLFQDTTTVSLTSRYYRIPDLERATPSEILIHEVMRVNISANGYSTESESPFCQIKGSGKTYYVNGTLVLPSIVTCDFTPLDLSIGDYTISVSSFGNNSDFYSRNNVPFKVTSLIDTLVLQNDLSDSSLYTIAARASPTASLPTIASPFMIALVDVNGVVVDVSGVVVSVTISPAPASNAFIGTSAETVSGVASLRIGLYAQYGERYTLSFRTSVTGAKTVNFTYVSVANCSTYYTPDADRLSCTCAIGAYYSASGCTPCLIGYYKNTTGTGSCTKCDQGYTTESYGATSISECVCEAGAYLVNTTTGFQCKTCPVGGTCAGGSARPVSKDGYFHKGTTEAFAEEAFYKCGTGSYCLANNTCRTGTEGFLCARCQDGYYRNNYDCEECSSITHGGGIIAIITIVLVFLVVAALLMGLFLPNGSFKFAALGIGLNTVQILALYQYLDVNWPDFITNTYIRFSFFNFSIGLSSPECSFSLLKDSLLKWKVTLFIPPAFAVLIFLCLLLLIFALFIFRKFGIIPMLQSPRYIFTNRQYFNAWKRVFIQFLVIVYTNM